MNSFALKEISVYCTILRFVHDCLRALIILLSFVVLLFLVFVYIYEHRKFESFSLTKNYTRRSLSKERVQEPFSRWFTQTVFFFLLKNRRDRANFHVSFHAALKVERRHTPCYQRNARDAFVSVFKGETTHGPLIRRRISTLMGLRPLEKGKCRSCNS